jgi:hypothetical protein
MEELGCKKKGKKRKKREKRKKKMLEWTD